ncbi:MAG: hypothetical protein AAF125_06780, partial [Chloroflexota bacterium]
MRYIFTLLVFGALTLVVAAQGQTQISVGDAVFMMPDGFVEDEDIPTDTQVVISGQDMLLRVYAPMPIEKAAETVTVSLGAIGSIQVVEDGSDYILVTTVENPAIANEIGVIEGSVDRQSLIDGLASVRAVRSSYVFSDNNTSIQVSCSVSTTGNVRMRVGPGENRTAIAFLPVDIEVSVTGQATTENGVVWYRVDKVQAAPNASSPELWIRSDSEVLTEMGDCSQVVDAFAPPVIPIIADSVVPPSTNEDAVGGDASETGNEQSINTETVVTTGDNFAEGSWSGEIFQPGVWSSYGFYISGSNPNLLLQVRDGGQYLDFVYHNLNSQGERTGGSLTTYTRLNQTTYVAFLGGARFRYIRFPNSGYAETFNSDYANQG